MESIAAEAARYRGECDECGWAAAWDEFETDNDGRTLCEECWEVAAEADPTNYFERID